MANPQEKPRDLKRQEQKQQPPEPEREQSHGREPIEVRPGQVQQPKPPTQPKSPIAAQQQRTDAGIGGSDKGGEEERRERERRAPKLEGEPEEEEIAKTNE